MFVMATIYAGDMSAPVKIRDLSPTGALIEGVQIPPVKSKVSLRRGILHTEGEIIWSRGGRAGMKFDAAVTVSHWLPGGEALVEQERVDAIFHGTGQSELTAEPVTLLSHPVTAAEIKEVKAELETLADALAEDTDVLMRHSKQMQALDLAGQLLERLADATSRNG